jgi:hypothetical protein
LEDLNSIIDRKSSAWRFQPLDAMTTPGPQSFPPLKPNPLFALGYRVISGTNRIIEFFVKFPGENSSVSGVDDLTDLDWFGTYVTLDVKNNLMYYITSELFNSYFLYTVYYNFVILQYYL